MARNVKGRRRPDTEYGNLPDDLQPGDYWRYIREGEYMIAHEAPGNLTGGVWGFMGPHDRGIGTLRYHTVRENEDGTISIKPGDGSSNSIGQTGPSGYWHGYIYDDIWTEQ